MFLCTNFDPSEEPKFTCKKCVRERAWIKAIRFANGWIHANCGLELEQTMKAPAIIVTMDF